MIGDLSNVTVSMPCAVLRLISGMLDTTVKPDVEEDGTHSDTEKATPHIPQQHVQMSTHDHARMFVTHLVRCWHPA